MKKSFFLKNLNLFLIYDVIRAIEIFKILDIQKIKFLNFMNKYFAYDVYGYFPEFKFLIKLYLNNQYGKRI